MTGITTVLAALVLSLLLVVSPVAVVEASSLRRSKSKSSHVSDASSVTVHRKQQRQLLTSPNGNGTEYNGTDAVDNDLYGEDGDGNETGATGLTFPNGTEYNGTEYNETDAVDNDLYGEDGDGNETEATGLTFPNGTEHNGTEYNETDAVDNDLYGGDGDGNGTEATGLTFPNGTEYNGTEYNETDAVDKDLYGEEGDGNETEATGLTFPNGTEYTEEDVDNDLYGEDGGDGVEPEATGAFPTAVDVSFHTDSEELPPELPINFIFRKVMEKFDEQQPGYNTINPGDELLPEEGARRELRGTSDYDDEEEEGDDIDRQLKLRTCPRCRRAKSYRRCLKNKCRSRKRRNRALRQQEEEEGQVPPGARRSTMLRRRLQEDTAKDDVETQFLLDAEIRAKNFELQVLEEQKKAEEAKMLAEELLRKEAALAEKKQMELQYELELAKKLNEELVVQSEQLAKGLEMESEIQTKVLELQVLEEQKKVEDVKILAEEAAKQLQKEELLRQQEREEYEKLLAEYAKQAEMYEKQWSQGMDILQITEEELKTVGKMENALNRLVFWFAAKYQVDLGIVVTRVA